MRLATTAALVATALALSTCGNTPQTRAAVKADRKRRAARVLAPRMMPAIQEQSQ